MTDFRWSVVSAAVLAAGLISLLHLPVAAQQTYLNFQGHQPIWQASVYGGFYDATGVIQGSVASADLWRYGGRYADGTPVSGAPKVRNSSGQLLSQEEYISYRQSLVDRLNRLAYLQSNTQSLSTVSWQRQNLLSEENSLRQELASLDTKYVPLYGVSQGAFYGNGSEYNPYSQYASPPAGQSSLKSLILTQGLNFLTRFAQR